MKISDIARVIEQIAPRFFQENYDNSGLILGSLDDEVKGVLICLDSTENVIDEAIKKNCNLVIAHHPIVFNGIKQLNGKNYIERILLKAVKNDIAIYACHTNLDNVLGGVNTKIAEKIGLKNCKVLAPKDNVLFKIITYCPTNEADEVRKALFDAGAGNIGNYSKCSFNNVGIGTYKSEAGSTPYLGKQGELHEQKELKIEVVAFSYQVSTIIKALIEAHPYEEVAYDVFQLDNESQNVGSGLIGELNDSEETITFLKRLKRDLKTDCIRYTSIDSIKEIKKVALCGGSGSFLLSRAKSLGADVFVTGDFKYHQFF